MLSQRIALLLHESFTDHREADLVKADLEKKVTLFKKSHELLKNEAKARDPKNKGLAPYYFEKKGLNSKTEFFLSEIERIRKSRDHNEANEDLIKFTAFDKVEYLSVLNGAVKLFEKQSSNLTRLRQKVEITLFAFNTTALILIFFLILKPLIEMISQREVDLKEARKRAEEESRFKTMFLANMSHELRSPLNGVLGTADLMGSTQLDGEQREYLQIINQSGKILLGVVNNILDLTKLQAGAVELEKVTFCPEALLMVLPKSFRYPIESKGINFIVRCNDLPKAIVGDTTRLSQILNNIIGNAVKFTDQGGITLKANYRDDKLDLSVTDTGIGMSKEALKRLFQSFSQADASTTRKFGGTGLGLSITKELIELMKGTLKVESEEGKGITFHLTIPFPLGDPSKIEQSREVDFKELNIENRNKKVLIVDDNDINRKLMTRILERYKVIPLEADSGRACLELLKEEKVDLILMDYHMPGLNGIETAEKAFQEFKNLPPIVALTADVLEETRQKVIDVGMKELIPKPVQRSDIQRILSTYLQMEVTKG